MSFSGPKRPICPEQNFFGQTTIITFIYLLALFIVQNLKKSLQSIQNYEDAPFLGPNGPFAPNYLLTPFIVQNFKKFFLWIQSYEDAQFLGPFPQMRILSENLLMSLVSFIHAYLHVKNQSQILIY